MLVVDALIAIAQSECPTEWARYCEVAPRVLGCTPAADAPRELLLQARLSTYDGSLRWVTGGSDAKESAMLDQKFLEKFVAAIQRGGELTPAMVDPKLIKVASLRLGRGDDEMQLAGARLFGVHIIMSGQDGVSTPQLRNATEAQIHADIKAEYDACSAAGSKPPNLKEIGNAVSDRLAARGLKARSKNQIQGLAGDPRYEGQRLKPGEPFTVKSKKPP
jgi:hypothetical protein